MTVTLETMNQLYLTLVTQTIPEMKSLNASPKVSRMDNNSELKCVKECSFWFGCIVFEFAELRISFKAHMIVSM